MQKIHKPNIPDFIVCGAPRAGTTSLWAALSTHPDICLASNKEPHFFSNDTKFKEHEDWYLNLFKNCNPGQLKGEFSTGYSIFPKSFSRIYEYNPDCKLIFLLRNPIDRMLSHYNYCKFHGRESLSFLDAVSEDRYSSPQDFDTVYKFYKHSSLYYNNISKALSIFSRDNILVLIFERLVKDNKSELKKMFDFLNVSELDIELSSKNISKKARFQFIQKLLYQDSKIKQVIKFCLADKFKGHIKDKVCRINSVRQKTANLTSYERKCIKDELIPDVKNLKLFLNDRILEWSDFVDEV